jgi:HEAT repeat protein
MTLAAQRAEALRQRVSEMSRLGDADVKEKLKDKKAEERWAAIWLLAYRWVHCEDALIDRLADPSPDVREAARQALVRLSRGTDFGPAPNAKPADRDKAIAKWRDWWAMQDDNPKNKKDGGTTIQTADPDDGKQKEADRLAESAVRGNSQQRADALGKLQAGQGGQYTLALAEAVARLEGDAKAEARQALAERLTRLTAGTLAQYLDSDDAELRRAAALALATKEDTSQVPKLIALLADKEPRVARAAHAALKGLSGQDFGPARDATAEERTEAIKKWRQWWEKHKEGKK